AGVFIWRVTEPQSGVNYVSWVVVTVCGVRTLLNFNPLLKLDGYYMLSDWLEVPNLRQRSWGRMQAQLRWLLWGAARPAPEPRGPVAGFLRVVNADEGQWVSRGAVVAVLEVPDLDSRLAQKRAEVRGIEANLRKLESGSRPEEIREQRGRVERGRLWRDLAK